MECKEGKFQEKGEASAVALPLTFPAAADSYPGIEEICPQTFWLFLWKLLLRKPLLHPRGTGTNLVEGPPELP